MGDDHLFREALAVNLRDDGHNVLACSAEETRRLASPVQVVVVVTPSRRESIEAIRELRQRQGDVPLLLVTVDPAAHDRCLMRPASVLTAPVTYETLHRTVDELAGCGLPFGV